MAQKIIIEAPEVWSYFQKNKEKLESSMHEIASNPEYGVEIYVTEENGLPTIIVQSDDTEVYSEKTINPTDCNETVKKIYDNFLTIKALDFLSDVKDYEDEGYDRLEREFIIDDREIELDEAVYYLIDTVCDGKYSDYCIDEDIVNDIKEHFLEYLARKWGMPIYRPMYLEDADGEGEFYEEYPYDYMVFEDEGNPIYS